MVTLLRKLLLDPDHEIWADDELRGYLHSALEEWEVYLQLEDAGGLSWDLVLPSWKWPILCRAARLAVFALEISGTDTPISHHIEVYAKMRSKYQNQWLQGVEKFSCR